MNELMNKWHKKKIARINYQKPDVKRSIQDVPNLRETVYEQPPMCGTCWFYTGANYVNYCTKYRTKVDYSWVCDDYTITPDVIDENKGSVFTINLASNNLVLDVRDAIAKYYGDYYVEWNDPATYHVTLVYFGKAEIDEPIPLAFPPFTVETTQLELWNVDEGVIAIVLRLEDNPNLSSLQAYLHEYCMGLDAEMSPYSSPAEYKPHITLGYLSYNTMEIDENGNEYAHVPVFEIPKLMPLVLPVNTVSFENAYEWQWEVKLKDAVRMSWLPD